MPYSSRRRGPALAAGLALAAGVVAAAPSPDPGDFDVGRALDTLDAQVQDGMRRTGVPGVAVAVVHDDKVVHLKGYGVRSTDSPGGKVGPDTVFQLASVSKPVASTVVAQALGADGLDDPLKGISLKDPWVSSHVTAADLLSHRSGLPDHSGDLLEDLGYDQAYILSHLRHEPLSPFRSSYAYTNFGFTAAAEAVATAKGVPWDKLSDDLLYKPAGMTHTSSRFSDYEKAADRALTHVKTPDGTWKPRYVRNPDAQTAAGGVSSNARDMARWLRLQLGGGKIDGKQVINSEGLAATHVPHSISQPPGEANAQPSFYGLGWNVRYDDRGRLRLSHAGGFALGANTNVTLVPAEKLAIVVLTNGAPVGLPDSVALNFLDTAEYGKPSRDWLPLVGKVYEQQFSEGRSETDYAKPPADPRPARADSAYTGAYTNPFYGRATVTAGPNGGLVLRLGPKPMDFPLTHYDGDTFSFETVGENAVGRTGVTFTDGRMRVEYLDANGLGTFEKPAR
ncbi:serine hydrolase [Streptomyces sp. NRRL F-2664]|uniref:serine hydrolase n=1 Tax=Streptomyces sp. NRRL F-2664 TaxID=1463842 RepID=UPI0004C99C43|nr:serine hydrolase [Streptomyces sp. NRRL F-2664]